MTIRYILSAGAVVALLFATFGAGFYVGKFEGFPYGLFQKIYWSTNDTLRSGPDTDTALEDLVHPARIVFVGDSVTAGGNWYELFPDADVSNRALGGYTIEELFEVREKLAFGEPEVIFILGGINDIMRFRSVDDILSDYIKLISYFTSTGANVYVQSTLPCAPERCLYSEGKVNELNDRLEAFAASEENVVFVDLREWLTRDGALDAEVTLDGIHPNAKGYRKWREIIAPLVEQHSTDRRSALD